ncbi:hypothetical protein [Flavobacterium cellulosilyticum]|uniref:Signal peptidase n=1 Tax=Flavobacterium cellulosilyticum TaxID=2541731 RepID=A0A4R5C526_9FLAO|nr:hypothetical protein [Flavobacterium cellulosilyticum]TDD94095.1 hypothetical protein E0F76_17545 [Flavobacterium cellulosilyticum]
MKKNVLKYYIAAFYLCSTFVMFAQAPDGGTGIEGDGDTTPVAPIDDYVWVLALIGLAFVFIKLRNYTRQTNPS